MIDLLNIKEIVNIIPTLIEYFVPGFIFLTIRSFSFSKDSNKDRYILMKAIIISYLFLEIINPIIIPVIDNLRFNREIQTYIFILVVIMISILYVKLDIEDKLINMLGSTKTSQEDYFHSMIDSKDGAWIRVYLLEEKIIYSGKLKYYEGKEAGENRKIVLTSFSTYSYDGYELENNENDEDSLVLLSMKDIKRLEIFK